MHYRPLGKTGLSVSEMGMGCNRLGEAQMPDNHWIDLVHAAADLGVTVYDTSESYGWGRSEEILGEAIGNRDDLLIASKVSRDRETNSRRFGVERIMRQVEGSLRRLRREAIDIYQLHSPSLAVLQEDDWAEAMIKLREQGKIRVIAVSINDAASGIWLVEQGVVEAFQVPYNMVEPQVGQAIFPLTEEHGVGIMVRVPMAQGILTGKFRPSQEIAEGHRAHLAGDRMESRIERAEAFRPFAEQQEVTFGQFALRYAISSTAVSTAIPGARNIEQLTQNVAASNGYGLDAETLLKIGEIQAQMT
jgi:aryl-alcohol dehydrogenase-like predicted oxidoreductase